MNNIYNFLLQADEDGVGEIVKPQPKPVIKVEPKFVPRTDRYDRNKKTILCKSIVFDKRCQYGENCFYAHSLAKQKMDPLRQKIYDVIRGNKVDITPDLYSGFLIMCNVCAMCSIGACTGGYNCRHGAVSKQYQVCERDLNTGDCPGCELVHLTERGVKPYTQPKKVTGVWSTVPKTIYNKRGESVIHICKPVKQFQPSIFELLKTPVRDLSYSESDDEEISAFLNMDIHELDKLDLDDDALDRSIFIKKM